MPPPSRRLDDPKPGYFLVRLVKGGPFVPAAIFHEFGVWRAEINGEVQPDPDPDPIKAGNVIQVWHTYRSELTRGQYELALRRARNPADPSSRPTEPVQLAQRQRF